ncbi:transcription antitermination factor NusB [Blattabacterium cuenoti]|uniref:transcription antitermination factor NusB n=1 Tax=Blattabacterium cuenoti TaxID=1653831 RepID=UPI00163D1907|nr:transcription antitermination factor NusB [Blattabacterium cuenoti]
MSFRRNYRIIILQFLYAQQLSKINLYQVEKNMLHSIKELYNIYMSFLCLILVIRDNIFIIEKKYPNKKLIFEKKFAYNPVIKILSCNKDLLNLYNSPKNLWKKNSIIFYFLKKMKDISLDKNLNSFEEEKNFLIKCYKNLFITNNILKYKVEELYNNGQENIYIAHNMVCKTLQLIKYSTSPNFKLYNYNIENKKFIIYLYRNTIINKNKFNKLINFISDNWNVNRISIINLIILQMAICEFLYFPNIPPKVTINEYIEITKIFCMEKSKTFINGILDQIYKYLRKKNKIFKI